MSDSFRSLFDAQNQHFRREGPADIDHRRTRLKALKAELLRRRGDLWKALHADFRKPSEEVDATEIAPVIIEINAALRHLQRWMKPRRLDTPLFMVGTRTEEHLEPRGVSLIISPWNYVVTLTLGPLVSAVAAGCPVVLKPSEHTAHTSILIDAVVASVFPRHEAAVVLGDASVAEKLLTLPFRHVHFTGSPRVGRIVMRGAAEYPASVTLELGGKSPAYVDQTANLAETADRLVFGKWTNAGQTCIAADYVLVHEDVRDALLDHIEASVSRMFGPGPAERRNTPDYARLIHVDHYDRIVSALDAAVAGGGRIRFGGGRDSSERYVEPTVVVDPPVECALMTDEIFGPVLPVVAVSGPDEAATFIRSLDPPLSMYVFGDDVDLARSFSRQIRTGAVCMN
ncbi:MAG: aldehyde dehydrogenase family protein, partial [Rhodothermales bacterium]|nr:aldehyde dehydrogenase family protein [Rhodothermales bacterium]